MIASRLLSHLTRIQSKCITFQRNYAENVKEIVITKLTGNDCGIEILGLNRAKQRNAFSINLAGELDSNIERIDRDGKIRVLLIRSLVPGVFCAGADLKERANMSIEQVSHFVFHLRALMENIHRLQIPVIAALDGLALGGGLELALACDIRVASTTAKLGLVETKLAILPGAGGTQRLPRLINPAIAKELIFTARVFDGKEAKDMGIVNHAVEQNENNDAAYLKSLEIAREILKNGPIGVMMAKSAINKGLDTDLGGGLEIEGKCYARVIKTKDRIEGFTAFNEKRAPKYIGE